MNAKHTPGPWRLEHNHSIFSECVKVVGDDKTVVVVNADDTMEVEDGAIAECLSPEAKANAKLIAAAPEQQTKIDALADALVGCLRFVEGYAYLQRTRGGVKGDRWVTKAQEAESQAVAIRAALRAAGRLP